jgi:hypothetical protein
MKFIMKWLVSYLAVFAAAFSGIARAGGEIEHRDRSGLIIDGEPVFMSPKNNCEFNVKMINPYTNDCMTEKFSCELETTYGGKGGSYFYVACPGGEPPSGNDNNTSFQGWMNKDTPQKIVCNPVSCRDSKFFKTFLTGNGGCSDYLDGQECLNAQRHDAPVIKVTCSPT